MTEVHALGESRQSLAELLALGAAFLIQMTMPRANHMSDVSQPTTTITSFPSEADATNNIDH